MTFQEAVKSCLSKYVTFSGRASRSEYWFFYLATLIAMIVAGIIDRALGIDFKMANPVTGLEQSVGYGWLYVIVGLGLALPSLAVGIRRLHDGNRSGWWWLIALTIIGVVVLLVWFVQKGTTGDNRYGPDPLGGDLTAAFS